jgi:hypothetical protein
MNNLLTCAAQVKHGRAGLTFPNSWGKVVEEGLLASYYQ